MRVLEEMQQQVLAQLMALLEQVQLLEVLVLQVLEEV
jgi:hypothetical protein